MKKILSLVLVVALAVSLSACGTTTPDSVDTPASIEAPASTETSTSTETPASVEAPQVSDDVNVKSEGVMTYAEYASADLDSQVTVECYVQAHQSWWDNQITVYAADSDGAYFFYNMACTEEDAAKLTAGTKIKATGFKSAWGGEVEIVDATFEIVEGTSYVADAKDLTSYLGTDELEAFQNQLASFKGMIVESVSYKNGQPGDDIYLSTSKDGVSYDFCVEYYLNGSDEAFYNTFAELTPGTVVDIEGYLYWYYGMNPHITSLEIVDSIHDRAEGINSYSEYAAADMESAVCVDMYVQAHQSWWDNKVTVYGADADGAYLVYNMECSEEDAAKLVPGTRIIVTGFKSEWSGEVEIVDATFEFGNEKTYIAPVTDVTDYIGTDDLKNFENQLVVYKDLTVSGISFKNDQPGDDIYLSFTKDDKEVSACLEYYLNGSDEEFYNLVSNLTEGTVVDMECFLYWYNGAEGHVTKITVK